jgi:glycosyltransferase involved in cell wall biosynthesis
MPTPAVSIIIPTHNRSRLLCEALDSVAFQTFKDYEVIVVDDGSTEPIDAALAHHATRPRVIRQQNLGPAAARNRGIDAATANLVAFLDSDDLWLPAKLETFLGYFAANPNLRIAYGPMSPIDADRGPVPGRTKPCHAGWITQRLFCSSFVHVPAVVAYRDVLVWAGGFNEQLPVCEDYDLWLRISVDQPFGLIEQPLALRRLHCGRLSKSRMSRNLAVKAQMLRGFYESGRAAGKLDRAVATARLAKVYLSAGRATFANGEYHVAVEHLRESRRWGGSLARLVPWLGLAGLMRLFERSEKQATDTRASLSPEPLKP